MATTVESPRVDIGALSGELRIETRCWLTNALVESPTFLALSEQDKVELTAHLAEALVDLDLAFARTLYTLEEDGVTTWGLTRDHEYLIVGKVAGDA